MTYMKKNLYFCSLKKTHYGPTNRPMDGPTERASYRDARTHLITTRQMSWQVPVGQLLKLFECALEPDQQGHFSSLCLEVMYAQTQLKSADNFARPVNFRKIKTHVVLSI